MTSSEHTVYSLHNESDGKLPTTNIWKHSIGQFEEVDFQILKDLYWFIGKTLARLSAADALVAAKLSGHEAVK
jgi:hypothetical protein